MNLKCWCGADVVDIPQKKTYMIAFHYVYTYTHTYNYIYTYPPRLATTPPIHSIKKPPRPVSLRKSVAARTLIRTLHMHSVFLSRSRRSLLCCLLCMLTAWTWWNRFKRGFWWCVPVGGGGGLYIHWDTHHSLLSRGPDVCCYLLATTRPSEVRVCVWECVLCIHILCCVHFRMGTRERVLAYVWAAGRQKMTRLEHASQGCHWWIARIYVWGKWTGSKFALKPIDTCCWMRSLIANNQGCSNRAWLFRQFGMSTNCRLRVSFMLRIIPSLLVIRLKKHFNTETSILWGGGWKWSTLSSSHLLCEC